MLGDGAMARAKQQVEAGAALYERDFYLWLARQAALLREGRLQELDIANLLEEIEDMGRSEKAAIENNLTVLLTHLLKYRFQPDQRSSSWRGSIVEHRRRLRKLIRESPSLQPYAHEIYAECYADSCEQAAAETALPPQTFSAEPVFALEQAFDPGFLPD
jgi:Domain of unknown function DUF29